MPYVYILECSDKTYYTGSAWNLEKRLWQHENGQGANYTKKRLPVKLVFCQEFERMDEAYYREKQVQGWSHAKKKALISGGFDEMQKLAECRNSSHYNNDPGKSAPLDSARGAALDSARGAALDSARGAGPV